MPTDADPSRLIDPDDLIDGPTAAGILGLNNPNGVSVYRRRYADFPEPVVERNKNVVLWLRQDIEAWAEKRRGS